MTQPSQTQPSQTGPSQADLSQAEPARAGNPELIADYACETGENPLWHPIEKQVYWTDIPAGRLFRYDPASGSHEQCYQGRPIGGFTIQADGSLLLFMDRGTVAVWRSGALTELVAEIPEQRESRFNDVIADPCGRVFCGTMSSAQNPGKLYRLNCDGSLQAVLDNVGCSNGMAFTLDGRGLFHTDSLAREISLFDYHAEDGSLHNRRLFARFQKADGLPDGATVDQDGQVWSAFWDGGCIARLGSDGSAEQRIPLPTPQVSSLTFGGDDYGDIYVTTAGGHRKNDAGAMAGGLFRIRSKVRGVPEFFSRVGTSST